MKSSSVYGILAFVVTTLIVVPVWSIQDAARAGEALKNTGKGSVHINRVHAPENGVLVESRIIVCDGPDWKARIAPVVKRLLSSNGCAREKFYLVGSESLFAGAINSVIKGMLREEGVGPEHIREIYLPKGHRDFENVVADISQFAQEGDACVLSTFVGDSYVHFQRQFAARMTKKASRCPLMAFRQTTDPQLQGNARAFMGGPGNIDRKM